MPDSPAAPRPPGPGPSADGDSAAAPMETGPRLGTPACSPPPHPPAAKDDFQFILCEGCRQESHNLKLLTCLHTLCLNCLSENKPIAQCPVCQTAIPQASGIPDMDNLLFTNLQARLSIYKKISDSSGPSCSRCQREVAAVWCSECEHFLCTKCFEDHQWFFQKRSHEARRVEDLRAESAHQFLEDTRKSCNLFCSSHGHADQGYICSIYCKKCEKPLCCSCALLDSQHAPFCDIRGETQRRQEELGTMSRELKQKRSSFEATYTALKEEASRLDQAQREMRELIRQRVEQLVRLLRQEEEELLGLVEVRQEQGRRELARELQRVEGVLRRMEAGERLVEKMNLYATEQEVMDMQPFIKNSLKELQQLQPPAARDRAQLGDLAECRTRLQALVERVTGHPACSVFLFSEATPAPAMKNSHQVSTCTPSKRKKFQNATVMTLPAKLLKVEDNDDGWKQTMPQQPSCSDQPGTSCLGSHMTPIKEESMLEDVPDGSGELHDSDSDALFLDSCEEDSTDEELLDPSLLDDPSNILDERTGEDYLGFPINNQKTLDTKQGSLVFFDVKILRNESIQVTVVDGEKTFTVLIHPMKYLSSLMARNNLCEIGLKSLLCHLNTVHRPILGGFGLWSLPFPTLFNALTIINKKKEFSSAVYGYLDILPLIKEKIPKRDNYKLKNLANTYLRQHFGDCSAMENAKILKYLCKVLDVDLAMKPRLILSQSSLESFISLQPLVAEKLLTKPSAQTLSTHSIGFHELRLCYRHDPDMGLQKMCRLINTHLHRSEKKVRNLSKVKVYFQRQELLAEAKVPKQAAISQEP